MNNFARSHLGFFFTSSPDSKEAQILETATPLIATWLRESRIRAGNLHDPIPDGQRPTPSTGTNWAQVGIFIENLGHTVQAHAQSLGLEWLSELDAAFAWSSALVFANMGARHEIIERMRVTQAEDTDGFVKVQRKK